MGVTRVSHRRFQVSILQWVASKFPDNDIIDATFDLTSKKGRAGLQAPAIAEKRNTEIDKWAEYGE
jgi:hypothetical protein